MDMRRQGKGIEVDARILGNCQFKSEMVSKTYSVKLQYPWFKRIKVTQTTQIQIISRSDVNLPKYRSCIYDRTEAIKQTTFFVVTQSFTLSCDLQTTKSSTS